MSNYTQAISFGAKDVLTSTDPAKIILGANVDSELALIATAITSKLNTSDLAGNYTISGNITFTGTNVIPAAGLTGTVVDARLSANVPLLNSVNGFNATGAQTFTSTGQYLGLNTTNANGGYISFARNGSVKGYVGDSKAISGGTLDNYEVYSNAGLLLTGTSVLVNGVNSTDFARLSQQNNFTDFLSSTTTGTTALSIDSTNAAGGFIRLKRAGTTFFFIGNANAVNGTTLDDGAVYANTNLRLISAGGSIFLNSVNTTDLARLSISNSFAADQSINKTARATFSLINTVASKASVLDVRTNSVSRGYIGADGAETLIAGAAAGDLIVRVESGRVLFSNDAGGTANHIFASTASTSSLNGIAVSDFARLSIGNTFVASNIRNSASPSLFDRWQLSGVDKAYVGVGGGSAISGLTSSDFGFNASAGVAFIATNGITRLSIDNAGTLAGSSIIGVAFSDFARLSQAVAFAATVTAATGLTVSANGATITGNSTITGTLGGLTGLTVASGGVNVTGTVTTPNTSANEVGYKGLPQNSQSVSYTTVLADCNKNLHQTGATKTFTIDSNANVAAPIGTVLNFTCDNATGVSIAITTDTLRLAGTATTGTRTLAQYGVASAIKILATTWLISGAGLS